MAASGTDLRPDPAHLGGSLPFAGLLPNPDARRRQRHLLSPIGCERVPPHALASGEGAGPRAGIGCGGMSGISVVL